MRLLRYLPPSARVVVFIIAFVAGKSSAASLLVNSNVVLNPGSYSYDSVTIEPQGTLQLLGDTTITTTGDFTIRSALTTNIFNDPDTGQTVTNYSILTGSIDLDRNEGLASGTNGAAG